MKRRDALRVLGGVAVAGAGVVAVPRLAPGLLAPPRAVTGVASLAVPPVAPPAPSPTPIPPVPAPTPAQVAALDDTASDAARGAVPPAAAAIATATPAPLPTIPVQPTATPAPTPAPPPRTANVLDTRRLVTWYGHPDSNLMGILGEYTDPRAMIAGLQAQTEAYTAADPTRPGLATIELIASVASHLPNADGLYLNLTRPKLIEEYVQMAHDNGCVLLLDIQFGYDSIENEVNRLLPYLRLPHVHLAIDPEFKVKRGQVPGRVYGSVTAAEVLYAAKVLHDLVKAGNLPEKILVLHQFRGDVFPDKPAIKTVPGVQMVVMMDGFGGAEAKIGNYGVFVRDQPLQHGGIKLFYKQDKPTLMTPKEIIGLSPTPLVVSYQ